jgi:hypothetical protein
MPAPRRLLGLPAAAALVLPACVSFEASLGPPVLKDRPAEKVAAPAKRDQFAELPSRPGEAVPKRAVAPPPKDATARKAAPVPPAAPADVKPAGEPGPFPLAPSAPPPPPTEPPLFRAVKAYAEGKPDLAIEILRSLDGPNQELVLELVPILTRGATADLAADPALAEQLHAVAARLEARAPLRVEHVALCRHVAGFGRYSPRPAGEPYKPNDQAHLYLEVRNLVPQRADGPAGETHLTHVRAAVEVRDAKNNVVPLPDPNDRRLGVQEVKFEKKAFTRGPVQDFHVLHPFQVPATPGVYTVTVEVSDAAGGRKTRTAPVQFLVAGP